MADNNKTISSSRSIALSSQEELGTVRPESLEQIGRFARAGRISPYRIKLSAISEKLTQSILSSKNVTPSHLESLDRVATLLLMKAQFVANGGTFPKVERKSVFDERLSDKVDTNQQTLLLLTQLIERNFHELSASYPRPKPETIVTEELRVPTAKRLLKIVERMSGSIQKPEKTITLQKKALDIRAAMREIMDRLRAGVQMLFSMLISPGTTKIDIIAKLLALLELTRRKKVEIFQESPFGPILIERK